MVVRAGSRASPSHLLPARRQRARDGADDCRRASGSSDQFRSRTALAVERRERASVIRPPPMQVARSSIVVWLGQKRSVVHSGS